MFSCFSSALCAQQLSDYGGTGEFSGVFRGISAGKSRLQGEKKPFHGWVMEDEKGRRTVFAILDTDASVAKVASRPDGYVGKKCIVVWDQVEEMLAGQREPTDLTRVRSVRWEGAVTEKNSARAVRDVTEVSMQTVVKSFFGAVENHNLEVITQILAEPVWYYQSRPISRSAAIADLKSDWKRYTDWHGEISNFESTGTNTCMFDLSYSLVDGSKQRSATLKCNVEFTPGESLQIRKISATVVKKTGIDSPALKAEPASTFSGRTRKFSFHKPEDESSGEVLHTIDIEMNQRGVEGVWTGTSPDQPDHQTTRVNFTGKILNGGSAGEKKVAVSFQGLEPYLFPANQKMYWFIRQGGKSGTTIRVPNYWVYGRTTKQVVWEFREITGGKN